MGHRKDAPSPVESLAAETSERATQRDQLPKRLQRYGQAKHLSTAMADYIRDFQPNHFKLASAIHDCGSYLSFHDYYTIGEVRLAKASLCRKHMLCPLCAIRRGAKHVGQKKNQVANLLLDNPDLEIYMMTLTVKDGDSLIERYNHLASSIKKFMKRRHLKRGYESEKILGSVWSTEVKRGKNSNQWHPHSHFVIVTDKNNPVSQKSLSDEWLEITRDSFIVDVRPIDHGSEESMIKGFCEVFKYAVKFSDQPVNDSWHCFETLKNRRLLGSSGLLFGIQEPEKLTDDLYEDLPFIEYFYRYIPQKGYRESRSKMMEYKTPNHTNQPNKAVTR